MYLSGKPHEDIEKLSARMQELTKGLLDGFPLDSEPLSLEGIDDIYQHFDWKGFQKSGVKSDIAAYLDSLKGYKKSTKRQELTDEQKRLIHRRWNKCFEEFHYEP